MKKSLFIILIVCLALVGLVSCKNEIEPMQEELVSISFEEGASRALTSTLEDFNKGAYYWKYAAKKADSSNLLSGQTEGYDTSAEAREAGARWVKEGYTGLRDSNGAYKVQGFSQGLWNFTLFAYKNVSTTETPDYQLVYQGETTGVLITAGTTGSHSVNVVVSPVQSGNGTLSVLITSDNKITLNPATPLPPETLANAKIQLGIDKLGTTTPTVIRELSFIDADYCKDDLEPGTYKVSVQFTNDDATVVYASGSVVATVYSGLTTTVSGSLSEVITYIDFNANQNPDIITKTAGVDAITSETEGDLAGNITLSENTSVVSATIPAEAAVALLPKFGETDNPDPNATMSLALNVDTTDSSSTSVTYDISMTKTVTLNSEVTTSNVSVVTQFVTVQIELSAGLANVNVTHSGTAMYPCTSKNDLDTSTEEVAGYSGFFFYDPAGTLYIKTKSFSPFAVTFTAIPESEGVAKIVRNGIPYYFHSLNDAIASAKTDDVIVILKDITSADGFKVDKAGIEFTIDTNGKTITVTSGSNINSRAFRIDNGKLIMNGGGKIVAIGSGTNKDNGTGCYGAFRVEVNGQLVVSDMTLTNARPWGLNVKVLGGEATLTNVTINSSYGGGIEVTEADLGNHSQTGSATLTNCTFTQTDYYDHCSTALSVSGNSRLVVNGGSYTSENYAIYVFSSGGFVEINDGTFVGLGTERGYAFMAEIDTSTYSGYEGGLIFNGGDFSGNFHIEDPATAVITGGSYSVDPTAYVPDDYIVVKEQVGENYVWKVMSIEEYGEEYYAGGTGTEEDPFKIATAVHMKNMMQDYKYDEDCKQCLNLYNYILTDDITLENFSMNVTYVYLSTESHDSYANAFFGVFDGNNHKITYTWRDPENPDEYTDAITLFGELVGSTIKNLTVDCDIVTTHDVGVLSSYTYYGASFYNVNITGRITSSCNESGSMAAITLATWELNSYYPAIFSNCTVDVDMTWTPVQKQGNYLYIAPYIGQLMGGTYLSFDGCTSSGSLTIPYGGEEVIGNVTDIYTGAFYARNTGYADVKSENCSNNLNTCENNISDFYTLHVPTGLPDNVWPQVEQI